MNYVNELFPEFLKDNPFESPEKYRFPFKFINLDHMAFVMYCDDRMEILRYADEREMAYFDFVNWAANHELSQKDSLGRDKYSIGQIVPLWPCIRRVRYDKKYETEANNLHNKPVRKGS